MPGEGHVFRTYAAEDPVSRPDMTDRLDLAAFHGSREHPVGGPEDPSRQDRLHPHERGDEAVRRSVHHLGNRPDLDDLPLVHHGDPVGQPEGLRLVVSEP